MTFGTEAALWAGGKIVEKSAETLLKEQGAVRTYFNSAWKRITEGKTVVVLNGMGGAGKTSLASILSGQKSRCELDPEYDLSTNNEGKRIKNDYYSWMYTRPGQPEQWQKTDEDLKGELKSAKKIFVINVVSYGYNSIHDLNYNELKVYDPKLTKQEVAENYLSNGRTEELNRLRSLCEMLRHAVGRPKFEFLTVANKMDMWWSQRIAVGRHYDGDYSKIVEDFGVKKAVPVRHAKIPVSLITTNIRTIDGIELVQHEPEFDAIVQQKIFLNFVSHAKKWMEQ